MQNLAISHIRARPYIPRFTSLAPHLVLSQPVVMVENTNLTNIQQNETGTNHKVLPEPGTVRGAVPHSSEKCSWVAQEQFLEILYTS